MTEASSRPSSMVLPLALLAAAALLIGYGAYQIDLRNVRPIAPFQDACTAHLYVWIPLLRHLPDRAWFVVSGIMGALAFLAVSGFVVVFADLSGGAEGKLKRLNENKRAHQAGFVS